MCIVQSILGIPQVAEKRLTNAGRTHLLQKVVFSNFNVLSMASKFSLALLVLSAFHLLQPLLSNRSKLSIIISIKVAFIFHLSSVPFHCSSFGFSSSLGDHLLNLRSLLRILLLLGCFFRIDLLILHSQVLYCTCKSSLGFTSCGIFDVCCLSHALGNSLCRCVQLLSSHNGSKRFLNVESPLVPTFGCSHRQFENTLKFLK